MAKTTKRLSTAALTLLMAIALMLFVGTRYAYAEEDGSSGEGDGGTRSLVPITSFTVEGEADFSVVEAGKPLYFPEVRVTSCEPGEYLGFLSAECMWQYRPGGIEEMPEYYEATAGDTRFVAGLYYFYIVVNSNKTRPFDVEALPGTITVFGKTFKKSYYAEEQKALYYNENFRIAEPVTEQEVVPVPTAMTGLVYNGAAQTGVPAGEHYSISGNKATNAGTYTATAVLADPTNYKWSDGTTEAKQISWKIAPKSVSGLTVTIKDVIYNKRIQNPLPTVKEGSKTLAKGTHYLVSYAAGRKNVGSYKVTVTGKGNYTGSKAVTFKINPKGTSLLAPSSASKEVTVKWKKQPLKMATSQISGYQIQLATNAKFKKGVKNVTVNGYTAASKTVTRLKAKTTYFVRIRTYKKVGAKKFFSKWSSAKRVTTK